MRTILQTLMVATQGHLGRLLLALLVLIVSEATTPAADQEGARLALLIGNSGYAQKVGPLKNPRNDVALVGAALNKLGFKVTIVEDADYRSMDTAIKRYVSTVRSAGNNAISFFYYSGHGVANPDTQINYLIPVDLPDPDDANIWYQSFQQNEVIDRLSKQAPNATHYVVFDACRNELKLSGVAAKALGAEKGFIPVQPTAGLLIAYATAPNRTASDAGEGSGPYAKALAAELVKPGVEAVAMFRNVQIRVKESIGQDPWLTFPSLPSVYLAGRASGPSAAPAHETGLSSTDVAQLCQSLASNPSAAVVQSLMEAYKGTPVATCARARLDELNKAQADKVARPEAASHSSEQNAPASSPTLSASANTASANPPQKVAVIAPPVTPPIIPGSPPSQAPAVAVARPTNAPATNPETQESRTSCRSIVGTWVWPLGVQNWTFDPDGAWRNSAGNTGKWYCEGKIVLLFTRANTTKQPSHRITISADGKSFAATGIAFTPTRKE
jgi:hypothetical protein